MYNKVPWKFTVLPIPCMFHAICPVDLWILVSRHFVICSGDKLETRYMYRLVEL